jgi:hypothetical protein
MSLQIDILYTSDCTDWELSRDLLLQALEDLGLQAEISYWLIENDRQALQTYFVGSPTIRVNGADLFPVEGATAGLRLRSYWTESGIQGHPTYDMIHEALLAFR